MSFLSDKNIEEAAMISDAFPRLLAELKIDDIPSVIAGISNITILSVVASIDHITDMDHDEKLGLINEYFRIAKKSAVELYQESYM